MPWKVKKVRRIGPFTVSRSTSASGQRIRSARPQTHAPLFGATVAQTRTQAVAPPAPTATSAATSAATQAAPPPSVWAAASPPPLPPTNDRVEATRLFGSQSGHATIDARAHERDRRARLAHQATIELQLERTRDQRSTADA